MERAEKRSKEDDIKAVYDGKSMLYKLVKRVADVVLSLLALVVLSPLLLVTALCIRLEDGGPALFTQMRMGKDMRPFRIYKFRSMRVNAEAELPALLERNEQIGHAFKIEADPRITKVGGVIRRLSIDELPQLINIIKGDMSIVGPRPILTWQMEACSDYEKQRLTVRPGLTCYWQIGGRASIGWDQWVEMDLDYIRDMSAWTDLKIIVRTLPAMFDREGAY